MPYFSFLSISVICFFFRLTTYFTTNGEPWLTRDTKVMLMGLITMEESCDTQEGSISTPSFTWKERCPIIVYEINKTLKTTAYSQSACAQINWKWSTYLKMIHVLGRQLKTVNFLNKTNTIIAEIKLSCSWFKVTEGN